jgi:hypothetical protein
MVARENNSDDGGDEGDGAVAGDPDPDLAPDSALSPHATTLHEHSTTPIATATNFVPSRRETSFRVRDSWKRSARITAM